MLIIVKVICYLESIFSDSWTLQKDIFILENIRCLINCIFAKCLELKTFLRLKIQKRSLQKELKKVSKNRIEAEDLWTFNGLVFDYVAPISIF